MTDQARLALRARSSARHASDASVRRPTHPRPTDQARQRDQQVAEVLAQLGRLAIHGAYLPGACPAGRSLDIEIDHASVMAIDDAGATPSHHGLHANASTLVRLWVTVRIADGDERQTTVSRTCQTGQSGPTDALIEALQHLAADRAPLQETQRSVFERPPSGALPPMTLAKVKAYIDKHLAERLQLADLAAISRLSVSRFISAFRSSTGTPPYRYLVQRRVAAAATLIRETNRTLTEIAQETGFSDQSHLCRSFAQILRMTPGHYRRNFR